MSGSDEITGPKSQKFLIMSSYTRMAYINRERRAFLMDDQKDADLFIKHTPRTYYEDKSRQKEKTICSYCYASGADAIIICNQGKKEEKWLNERHLDKHYYNGRLSADITRLVHTQDIKYLKDFAECNFIVPIRITNADTVSIVYATVKKDLASENYSYLAFTDLNEYDKWAKRMPNGENWKPLRVDAAGLKRIGKDHGITINVYSGRNTIRSKDLKLVKTEDDD